MVLNNEKLIEKARKVARLHKPSEYVRTGEVGCALVTDKGNVYVGASIDAPCGVGFCAEHSAIAAMVTNGEYRIKRIVAVSSDGVIMPPCGRCREMMYEMGEKNLDAEVIVGKKKTVRLRRLLPRLWQEMFKSR
jgi:cytidine deaminase